MRWTTMAENLVYIRGLDVRLSTVSDTVLQHFLYSCNQEDVCMGVGHWKDTLEEREWKGFFLDE